jgi:hypothetical protein
MLSIHDHFGLPMKVRNQDVEELEFELNQLENPLDANKDVNNIVKEELDYIKKVIEEFFLTPQIKCFFYLAYDLI